MSLSTSARTSIQEHVRWLLAMRGEKVPSELGYSIHRSNVAIRVCGVKEQPTTVNLGNQSITTNAVQLTLEVTSDRNEPGRYSLLFGTNCLYEGLAWEIERLLLEYFGQAEKELANPKIPYEIMRAVYEYYNGHPAPTLHLIRAGLLALQSSDPASSYIELCVQLRNKGSPTADDPFPEEFVNIARNAFSQNIDALFHVMVDPLIVQFERLGKLAPAFRALSEHYRRYLVQRGREPFFDIAFVDPRTDMNQFWKALRERPPCPVRQRTDADAQYFLFDGHLRNPGASATQDDTAIGLGIYQCMQALVLAHTTSEFLSTDVLAEEVSRGNGAMRVSCPLFGACAAPQATNSPEICQQRPWDSPSVTSEICWYAYAKAALAKSAR